MPNAANQPTATDMGRRLENDRGRKKKATVRLFIPTIEKIVGDKLVECTVTRSEYHDRRGRAYD